jgi:hypothetical protein
VPKIICPYCCETQDVTLKVTIDWTDRCPINGDTAAGRVVMRCRHCGREIINHRFEE